MKFRTEIEIEKAFELHPQHKVLTLGSCFADRMGGQLQDLGVDCMVNPFGVLYNPLVISGLVKMSMIGSSTVNGWFEQDGRWLNHNYHGSVSGSTEEEAVKIAENIHQSLNTYLRESSLLVITLGTAYVYEEVDEGNVVANCHRQPAENFERRLLTVKEIVKEWRDTLALLKEVNKKLKVLFTVSPVRHVRDSLVQNQVSKSTLHLAVHEVTSSTGSFYFPSYEIMLDDLRDYRFYEDNLVQPNSQALTYINEKFAGFCYSNQMVEYSRKAVKLQKRLEHKVMSSGVASEKFTNDTERKLQAFQKKYPFSKITKR